MAYKPLANTIAIGTANNCYEATAVLVTATTAAVTVTVANTADPSDSGQHGNYAGGQVSIRLAPNSMAVVRKRPQDTIQGTGCYGTKVAENGA